MSGVLFPPAIVVEGGADDGVANKRRRISVEEETGVCNSDAAGAAATAPRKSTTPRVKVRKEFPYTVPHTLAVDTNPLLLFLRRDR